jgi:hypothetical protein
MQLFQYNTVLPDISALETSIVIAVHITRPWLQLMKDLWNAYKLFLFYLLYVVQTGSGTHPAYPMWTKGSFPESKADGAWRRPLTGN